MTSGWAAGGKQQRKEVKAVVESMRRWVQHGYFTKRVFLKEGQEDRVSFTLTLTECPISDEQMGKLLDILEKAAEEADAVMGR